MLSTCWEDKDKDFQIKPNEFATVLELEMSFLEKGFLNFGPQ
jgi:hypothetical protein